MSVFDPGITYELEHLRNQKALGQTLHSLSKAFELLLSSLQPLLLLLLHLNPHLLISAGRHYYAIPFLLVLRPALLTVFSRFLLASISASSSPLPDFLLDLVVEAPSEAMIGYYESCLVFVESVIFVLADRNSVAEIEHYSGIEVDDDSGSCFLERASDFDVLAGVPAGFGAH